MFIHNFKYALKTLFRNRILIFWTFAFPIILGTFFNMAFSNIENSEKLEIINIAIINNDSFNNNQIFKQAIKELSDEENENRLFNTKYVSQAEAKQLLKDGDIIGYMLLEENEPKIVVQASGINETVFKYVIEEIVQTSEVVKDVAETKIRKEK